VSAVSAIAAEALAFKPAPFSNELRLAWLLIFKFLSKSRERF
jgi:hypothetical protein